MSLNNLRPLTQEQRHTARQAAQRAVVQFIGPRPVREQFAQHTISKYPQSVTRLISLLCIILLLAAFTPSAIRLYVIGSQTFGQAVDNSVAMTAVGIATVLSAEVGQVVFSLALATLGTSRSSRRLLYTSMAISTILALTGNIQIALPGHADSPFAWLEAIAPPLLVLSTAYVHKFWKPSNSAMLTNARFRLRLPSGKLQPPNLNNNRNGPSSTPMRSATHYAKRMCAAKMHFPARPRQTGAQLELLPPAIIATDRFIIYLSTRELFELH